VVVRGMRSGLPLTECINIIGREMPDPLGAEFRLVTEGQKLGLSLQESLERVLERNPTPDFRYFTIVLAIQQQTGGNLAETLAKLSELLRGRARMRDKIKAYSSEATASALIIGSLPLVVAALLLVVSHEYVMVLFNTEAGNVLLVIGALMMGAGALIMRKMISFDI
jgi:tight adherence protein B